MEHNFAKWTGKHPPGNAVHIRTNAQTVLLWSFDFYYYLFSPKFAFYAQLMKMQAWNFSCLSSDFICLSKARLEVDSWFQNPRGLQHSNLHHWQNKNPCFYLLREIVHHSFMRGWNQHFKSQQSIHTLLSVEAHNHALLFTLLSELCFCLFQFHLHPQ